MTFVDPPILDFDSKRIYAIAPAGGGDILGARFAEDVVRDIAWRFLCSMFSMCRRSRSPTGRSEGSRAGPWKPHQLSPAEPLMVIQPPHRRSLPLQTRQASM